MVHSSRVTSVHRLGGPVSLRLAVPRRRRGQPVPRCTWDPLLLNGVRVNHPAGGRHTAPAARGENPTAPKETVVGAAAAPRGVWVVLSLNSPARCRPWPRGQVGAAPPLELGPRYAAGLCTRGRRGRALLPSAEGFLAPSFTSCAISPMLPSSWELLQECLCGRGVWAIIWRTQDL